MIVGLTALQHVQGNGVKLYNERWCEQPELVETSPEGKVTLL